MSKDQRSKLQKAPCGVGTIIRGSGVVEGYRVAVRGIMAQLRYKVKDLASRDLAESVTDPILHAPEISVGDLRPATAVS